MEKHEITDTCKLCDISIECHWTPGRGRGIRDSVMYLLPAPTKSDYKNGICTSRNTKKIQEYNKHYNFNAYYTSLIKCVAKDVIRRIEFDNCRPRFQKELFEVNPKIIVTIGHITTNEFLKYTYFNNVVDKAHIIKANNKTIIIYPIFHPSYDNNIVMKKIYDKSFDNIAKLYKAFIDPNYFKI